MGDEPTGMVVITNPSCWTGLRYLVSPGKGGFIVKAVPLSEPGKVYEEPLPVVALMLNWFAVGHGTAVGVKVAFAHLC